MTDQSIFTAALKACKELKLHINGQATLEEHGVDVRRAIIMEASEKSLYFFAKAVLGFDKLTKETHARWCQDIQDKFWDVDYYLRLKPRGTFKTTIYSEALPLWIWATISPAIKIFSTSSSAALISEVSAHMDAFIGFESDSLYSFVFGIQRDKTAQKNTNTEFNIIGRDKEAKGHSLVFRTAGGSTNGIHPSIIIIDDPCFSKGTPILTSSGYKGIEDIQVGDKVMTRKGYKRVTWSGKTAENAVVQTYNINGCQLTMTPNHKVITDKGNVPVKDLDSSHIINLYEGGKWKSKSAEIRREWYLKDMHTDDIQNQNTPHLEIISIDPDSLPCTKKSGNSIEEKYPKDMLSITRIMIQAITKLKTLNALIQKHMIQGMRKLIYKKDQNKIKSIWPQLDLWLHYGTSQMKEEKNKAKLCLKLIPKKLILYVNNAMVLLRSGMYTVPQPVFVQENANLGIDIGIDLIMSLERARSVIKHSKSKNGEKQNAAQKAVQPVIDTKDVYNITVDEEHEYIANGLLVKNCDKEDRVSEATRKAKRFWFDSLTPLLVPHQHNNKQIKKIMIVGTRWHFDDLMNTAMEKGIYDCEIESIYDDNGKPSYPEFFPQSRIDEIEKDISSVFFSSQYRNTPQAEEDQIFVLNKMHLYPPSILDVSRGTNYCFFDPSLGKQSSMYPAVVWVNLMNGKKYIFDSVPEIIPLAGLMNVIVSKCIAYGVKRLVYETNGTTLLDNVFNTKFKELGYNLLIDPIHETRNKDERICTMQPDLYSGDVLFRNDYDTHYKELMNQILFYPVWKYKDFPDVVEKAISYISSKVAGTFVAQGSGSSSGASKRSSSFSGSLRKNSNW